MDIIAIQINCPSEAVAEAIADELLSRRLVAAANIHAGVRSRYHWRGAVVRATEVPLVLKTRATLFEAVAAAARALHPYETPAITATTIPHVTADYRAWVVSETECAA
ncbi:MAG TPA: divalent-cation tolerance protein CutA [Paracoccaceae bacterium]|nr:divalent-cation tolerance protein CutA [Paracoccaceae bacterium]